MFCKLSQLFLSEGANTGVGKETVKVCSTQRLLRSHLVPNGIPQALLNHNAKVYLAARNRPKAEQAVKDLKEATGKDAIFLELDLSSIASVRKAASEFLSKEFHLHILFCNA